MSADHLRLDETTPWVRQWLRAEGFAGLVLGWVVWQSLGGELLWFVPALLLPDVTMLGYLGGNHTGAIAYNLAHTLTLPLALLFISYLQHWHLALALIWTAHIAFDRLLGYGLKYPTSFQDTHLGRIGRR